MDVTLVVNDWLGVPLMVVLFASCFDRMPAGSSSISIPVVPFPQLNVMASMVLPSNIVCVSSPSYSSLDVFAGSVTWMVPDFEASVSEPLMVVTVNEKVPMEVGVPLK